MGQRSALRNFSQSAWSRRYALLPPIGTTDLLKATLKAAAEALIILFIALLNPFEIAKWGDDHSHEIWERLAAQEYAELAGKRHGAPPDAGEGRNAITVLYYDDASIARLGKKLPLSAFDLADTMDDVVALAGREKPKALFIDLLLTNAAVEASGLSVLDAIKAPETRAKCATRTGSDLSPFRCLVLRIAELTQYDQWSTDQSCQDSVPAKIACIQAHHGMPIFLADPRIGSRNADDPLALAVPSPALDALDTIAAALPVDIAPHEYPLVTLQGAEARKQHRYRLYPAAALYAVWCGLPTAAARVQQATGPCRQRPVLDDEDARLNWSERFDAPLDIDWAAGPKLSGALKDRPERLLVERDKEPCAHADPSLGAMSWQFFRMLTAGIGKPEPKPCIYTRAFPNDITQTAGFSAQDGRKIFGGKLVLIGSQFADSNDVLKTAPLGNLPGVYFHAMALDNLIERGENYSRVPAKIADFLSMSRTDLFNFVVMFVIAFILAVAVQWLKHLHEHYRIHCNGGQNLSGRHAQAGPETLGGLLVARLLVVFLAILIVFIAARFFIGISGAQASDLTGWVPASFNIMGVVMIVAMGVCDLLITALEPVFEEIGQRFSTQRLFRAAQLVASGQPIEPAQQAKPRKPRTRKPIGNSNQGDLG